MGYSPWGCKESDTTERLHFHFQQQGLTQIMRLCWQSDDRVLRERQMYGRKAWSVTLEWGMHLDLTEEVGEWRIITETWDIRGYKKPHSPTPLPFN